MQLLVLYYRIMLETALHLKNMVNKLNNVMRKIKKAVVYKKRVIMQTAVKVVNGTPYTVAILTKPKKVNRNPLAAMQLMLF